MIIYVNGKYVEEERASISPFDHGFLYGMGLFETIRIYGGHPFLLDDHLTRMAEGLEEMFIKMPLTREQVLLIMEKLLSLNGITDARVRINVSAGREQAGMPAKPYTEPSVLMFISSLGRGGDELKETKARILSLRRDTPPTLHRHKSHHFGNNIAAKMEMLAFQGEEGIFLSQEGFVAEGITSNIFWVKNNVLYTPDVSVGILPGITRKFIMGLANKMGIPLEQGHYFLPELQDAEEVFLTNSIQEMTAVTEILNVGRYKGKNGTITKTLSEHYKKYRCSLWKTDSVNR